MEGILNNIFDINRHVFDQKISVIIKKYNDFNENLINIQNDIFHLNTLHHKFTKNSQKKFNYANYGSYVDDIYFQKVILEKDYKLLRQVNILLTRKLYRDLFKLYHKIIKEIIVVYLEIQEQNKNDQLINNIKGDNIDDLVSELKQKLMRNIKIYKESDISVKYDLNDVNNIYNLIIYKMNDLNKYILELMNFIKTAGKIESDGYLINNFLIGMSGEKEKMKVNQETFKKILNDILDTHLKYVTKYYDRSESIANEISESTNKLITSSPSSTSPTQKNLESKKSSAAMLLIGESFAQSPAKNTPDKDELNEITEIEEDLTEEIKDKIDDVQEEIAEAITEGINEVKETLSRSSTATNLTALASSVAPSPARMMGRVINRKMKRK